MKKKPVNGRSSRSKSMLSGESGYGRSLFMGAVIGLYFGWFFRPVREPSLLVVIGLSLLIAFVLLVFSAFRREGSLAQLIRGFFLNVGKYMVVVALLEGRHFFFDWGGRAAVVAASVIMGMVVGLWFGWRQPKTKKAVQS